MTKRPTRKELVSALRFIAVVPQAYSARGPEFQVRQMEQVARDLVTRLDRADREVR